jgi:glyoxylase-like metal-dependent hydrolase (beta-lactamase superfamily II)
MSKPIIISPGKINEYLHLVDLKEFGIPHILSSFIAEFDECSVIMDCGSSLDVVKLIKYLKAKKIPLETVKFLISSHHHFDHNGGMWKLYEEIKKFNPDVKILTNKTTKELLNNYDFHLKRGKRTYGDLVGKMKTIEESAFEIIEPSNIFTDKLPSLEYLKKFKSNGKELNLSIFNTPGHTPDHQSIAFVNNNEIEFIFYGEAVGTLYHSTKLVTTPTSMPLFFNYEKYMNSLYNLEKLKTPLTCGFAHYGVVKGKENVNYILQEHEEFMKAFRTKVIKYYKEQPETKYVFQKLIPFFNGRYDISFGKRNNILNQIILGLVYGMMMDLGYRQPEDYELKLLKKYEN